MSEKPRLGTSPLLLYLLLLFTFLLVLSSLTPMVLDDFTYCFSFADQSRITSLAQIPASMDAHRQHANGRLLAHCMVQLLLLFPKALFNVLNAGNAVLLAYLFSRYFRDLRAGATVLALAMGAMLIWNFSPAFGESFLWLDGAANYAWGMSLLLAFLWPYAAEYLGLPGKGGWLRGALFLLLAFAAGSYSENGSLATIFAGLCLFLLLLRERKPRWLLLAGLLAAALGFLWLMTAPASSSKAAKLTASVLAANVTSILKRSRQHLLILYLLYALLLAAALQFKADRRKLILSGVLILAGIASQASFAFAKYFENRHFCYTVVVTSLACLLPFTELLRSRKELLPRLATAAMATLFLFNLAAGMVDIVVDYSKSLERRQAILQAREAGQTELYLEQHLCATPYGVPFVLNGNPRDWPNLSIARYYGFDLVHGLGVEP